LTESVSNDREVLLLTGVFVALVLWFAMTGRADTEPAGALEAHRAVAEEPMMTVAGTFDYVPPGAKALRIPAGEAQDVEAGSPPPATAGSAPDIADPFDPPPLQAASVEAHALLAEPLFDPLGTAVLSGLPQDATLSAGAQISAAGGEYSDWAIAFGDLDNLVVHLPSDRTGPIRARLDLRTRAGVLITSLNVEVREDVRSPATPTASAPPVAQPVLKAVKAARATEKSLEKEKARRATAMATKQGASKPLPTVSKPVAPPAGKTAGSTDGGLAPLPAPVLFKPDPKDSSLNGLSPTLRDDPRFMTLRGLGMPPEDPPGDDPPLFLFPVVP
jgi:hypothetical protein